jgi:hypothetical protein
MKPDDCLPASPISPRLTPMAQMALYWATMTLPSFPWACRLAAYSYRSATIGSTRDPRRAGISDAATDTAASSATAAA